MSTPRPVVASRIGGNREQIVHGETGASCKPARSAYPHRHDEPGGYERGHNVMQFSAHRRGVPGSAKKEGVHTLTVHSVSAIDRSVHTTNRWLAELADELRYDDREAVWRALRAYLQVLRAQLTTSEAAQLGAQLPLVVRGAYYESFDPDRQPERLRDRDAFLDRLAELGQLDGASEASHVASSATSLLSRHVSRGEIEDALAQLPGELREVLRAD